MEKFRGRLIKIRFWYCQPAPPRAHTAGVSIILATQDKYEFTSSAQWIYADYSKAVEKGIIEGLRESGYDPDLGIGIRLEAIEEDPLDSSERDFFIATKCAVQSKILTPYYSDI